MYNGQFSTIFLEFKPYCRLCHSTKCGYSLPILLQRSRIVGKLALYG
jgi:hypothetical protein